MADPIRNRGLLTKADRQHVAGNSTVENPDARTHEMRHNVHQRLDAIPDELALLREHGHDELADDILKRLAEIVIAEGGETIQSRFTFCDE
jgi:hypothetical protein